MSRVLVTGGAGFIGTHLCRVLRAEGRSIRSLDLHAPSQPVPEVEYIKGDIRDSSSITAALEGCDVVFHLAAVVSVPLCQEQPLYSYETNFMGTCRVLEAARQRHPRPRVVLASTCAVYGALGGEGIALKEDIKLPSPLSVYAAQKLASEHAVRLFHEAYGIPAVVFRFFNVFGRGQKMNSGYTGVISLFLDRLRQNLPLELHGGGEQTRDFISVAEVVDACVKSLRLPESQCDGIPINVGSGRAITIRRLAEVLQDLTHRKTGVLFTPTRTGDVPHALADLRRAETVLGWKPFKGLETALSELVQAKASEEARETPRDLTQSI